MTWNLLKGTFRIIEIWKYFSINSKNAISRKLEMVSVSQGFSIVSCFLLQIESQQILIGKAFWSKIWKNFHNSLLPHQIYPPANVKFLGNQPNKPFGGVQFESPPANVSVYETF